MKAYTDYPILELGDISGEKAPIREVRVISYDLDKYCKIEVCGIQTEVKRGYLYVKPGRCGEVKSIDTRKCKTSSGKHIWKLEKAWGTKVRYFALVVGPLGSYKAGTFQTLQKLFDFIDKYPGEYDVSRNYRTWGSRGGMSTHAFYGTYISNSLYPKFRDYRKRK
jgi:hypothetical protein